MALTGICQFLPILPLTVSCLGVSCIVTIIFVLALLHCVVKLCTYFSDGVFKVKIKKVFHVTFRRMLCPFLLDYDQPSNAIYRTHIMF